VGVSEGRHENFSSHLPLKATLLDPVATCFNDCRKASQQGKMFPLGTRGRQEIHERGRQSVNTGNQWVTQMEWGFRGFFFPAWTALL
jgi:hypothetical protein